MIVRLCKAAMVWMLAAFAAIVAYDNIVDYDSNYVFVQHVLSMDTTFPNNALKHRAITDPASWRLAYRAIIATEALTALLLFLGGLAMLVRLRSPADRFQRAKAPALLGVTIGFGLWFFGFMAVGGEYFAMWQSQTWNGQQAAFRFYVALLGVAILVNQRDADLPA